ncbi:MAG TPA: cell division protein ZapA [Candidatus Cloacimonadota bacterium]|jgi:cell division protein ZapA (FtsZ GTPase activity inhibitor)|nr:cell division protein ZapA [Candidatus Cloacimonadota bacterium]HOF59406.1 cell division protein ZapA [Candidatus Cloacimonadota bacterium]HOR58556.1 cell division protein ZapA [Candidatus Cloacimonadota bacterium]HPB08995.1 cell division protein ZapA [Candidatus Cloacimonadota bacterium]HQL12755.1 cell division protein ZapA [Candidatus Cloacimonadota bacterium]
MKMVEVEIFGRKYRLRSDNTEATQAIANSINSQLNELHEQYENLDFTKLLLLLVLKQQEELRSLENRNSELSKELERVSQMVGKIIGEI